jgi:threonine/homoserine/homoserine lactone efflux protein
LLAIFTYSFGLALAFCLSPGPVFAESLRQGLKGGFRPALFVQFGSLVGDLAWALAAFGGLGLIFTVPAFRLPLELAGATFLFWLAWDSFRSAPDYPVLDMATEPPRAAVGALASGVILSVTNPKNIPFWVAVGTAMGGLGVPEPISVEGAVFLSGFMAACVGCCFVTSAGIAWLHRHLTPRLFFWINIATSIALATLATIGLISALQSISS